MQYIHTMMYYYSALRRKFWHMLRCRWSLRTVTKGQILYDPTYICEALRMVKLVETENREVVSRGWGRENMGSSLMGKGFQFGMIKKVWRWMTVMVAQKHECTLYHKIVQLMIERVNLCYVHIPQIKILKVYLKKMTTRWRKGKLEVSDWLT